MTFLNRLARIFARSGNPTAMVPQHNRPAAIFALGDRPLESTIIERMVLDVHREALLVGVEARSLGHSPALQDSVEFEPEVPVEARRLMLLDDEAVSLAFELPSARLL